MPAANTADRDAGSRAGRPLPEVEIIDMREKFRETGQEPVVSRKLAEEIGDRLKRQEQVMVLLNRRGYAPVVLCRTCGNTIQCRNCDIPMTHHKGARRIECHYCGYMERVPEKCPKCGSEYVYFLGAGSEKLEEHLHGMFPPVRASPASIAILSADATTSNVPSAAMPAGEVDLVVGTQMIAKGHDFPGVTLVGVVGADTALKFADFRAAERTFQLLTQVAGRAGRGDSAWKSCSADLFPRSLRSAVCRQTRLRRLLRKGNQVPQLDEVSAIHRSFANVLIRSDQLDDALKYAGWIGHWFQGKRAARRQSTGAGTRYHRSSSETRLPLSLHPESREPRKNERSHPRYARLRLDKKNSAHQHHRRCRRTVTHVDREQHPDAKLGASF